MVNQWHKWSYVGLLINVAWRLFRNLKVERMIENRDIFGFELNANDLAKIATLNRDEVIFNHHDPNMIIAL